MAKVISKPKFVKNKTVPQSSANKVQKGWNDPDEYVPRETTSVEIDAGNLEWGIRRLWDSYENAIDMNRRGNELSNTLYYRNDKDDSTGRGSLDREVKRFLEHNLPESVGKYQYMVDSFRGDALKIVEEASSKFDILMGRYNALLKEIETEANDKIRDLEGTIGY